MIVRQAPSRDCGLLTIGKTGKLKPSSRICPKGHLPARADLRKRAVLFSPHAERKTPSKDARAREKDTTRWLDPLVRLTLQNDFHDYGSPRVFFSESQVDDVRRLVGLDSMPMNQISNLECGRATGREKQGAETGFLQNGAKAPRRRLRISSRSCFA